jgi:hypothetical protein
MEELKQVAKNANLFSMTVGRNQDM